MLTLQKIRHTPGFSSGAQVKVSHSAVAMTRIFTGIALRSDWMLRVLFDRAASGLPLASSPVVRRAPQRVRRNPEPAAEYAADVRRTEGRSVQ